MEWITSSVENILKIKYYYIVQYEGCTIQFTGSGCSQQHLSLHGKIYGLSTKLT